MTPEPILPAGIPGTAFNTLGVDVIAQHVTERAALYNADTCEAIQAIPDNSVGLSVYSPPFAALYIYSDSIRDMGNSADEAEFFEHYRYLIPHIYRITKPGRVSVVHCADLPRFKFKDGVVGLKDFPGEIIRAHEEAGWVYTSRVTIWKDPVVEMQRTKSIRLLYKQLRKDATQSGQGIADYLLVFRKVTEDPYEPVTHTQDEFPLGQWQKWASPVWDTGTMDEDEPRRAHTIDGVPNEDGTYTFKCKCGWSHGPFAATPEYHSRFLGGGMIIEGEADEAAARHLFDSRVPFSLRPNPVWMDIDQGDVLNVKLARTEKEERHLCPLQLGVIDRVIRMWSNPGDVVFSPFGGIGSEPYTALKLGRRALAVELKPEYFKFMVRNCKEAEASKEQMGLLEGM